MIPYLNVFIFLFSEPLKMVHVWTVFRMGSDIILGNKTVISYVEESNS